MGVLNCANSTFHGEKDKFGLTGGTMLPEVPVKRLPTTGSTSNRNGPEWAEMDRNEPEWTEMGRNGELLFYISILFSLSYGCLPQFLFFFCRIEGFYLCFN